MTVIDDRGRLFGRINLIDASAAVLLFVLIPVAYGAYLLFRTPQAKLTSITPDKLYHGPNQRIEIHGLNLRPYMRVTFGGSDDWQPFWSPDGKTLAFMSYRNGVADLFAKSLAGAVPEQPLLPSNQDRSTDDQRVSGDWSADGKRIYISDEYGPYIYEFDRASGQRIRALIPGRQGRPGINA